jgi:hypothetical protein
VGLLRKIAVLQTGLVLLSASLLMSCASTTMTSTWRDSHYAGGPLKKIAVIVVEKNEDLRRFVEDQATRNIPDGTQAVPGYVIFGTLDEDKDKIKKRLIQEGFDGALVGRLAAIVRDETYRPPHTYITAASPFMYGTAPYSTYFDGYYGYAYSVAYAPAYHREDTRYVVETLLYKLPEGKPIWTGTSESVNPNSRQELVAEITRLVGNELRKEKLVGAP